MAINLHLHVNKEYQDLVPALTDKEYQGLMTFFAGIDGKTFWIIDTNDLESILIYKHLEVLVK